MGKAEEKDEQPLHINDEQASKTPILKKKGTLDTSPDSSHTAAKNLLPPSPISTLSTPFSTSISALCKINSPTDLKALSDCELKILAEEVRGATICAVAKTGGHLGASLGVVELTTALHAIFDTPRDKLIWDVGHQCYPHKILTGRHEAMSTLRQSGGLSGFTKRCESVYDPFGAGHSSTSISAALGMATARDIKGEDNAVIAVIGDGSMSAGMAYEAMNNAGDIKSRLIVILNDNDMSIDKPVGALSRHLTKLVSSKPYIGAREVGKKITEKLPAPLRHVAKRAEESARMALGTGSLFEEMGFYYIGPVDGHNMDHLLPVLRNLRDAPHEGPVLLHVLTQKGKGYGPAENAADKMHGVKKFDVITGDQVKSTSQSPPSYTDVFAQSLINQARTDEAITAITAAMPSGTGLDKFADLFPERLFDVGIAEQHAVTFAAGQSTQGLKPFVTIYSTFLQRAYDQIVHDVALQNLPVRFAIDRAGLVGADGATHAGAFDLAFLGNLPNMTLMAPSDEAELVHMVATAAAHDTGPIAFRYPRGEGFGVDLPETPQILEIGKGRVIYSTGVNSTEVTENVNLEHRPTDFRKIEQKKSVALLSYGTRLQECLKAAALLEEQGYTVTVADARFAKPLDEALIRNLTANHAQLLTIEEGATGGFGSFVLEFCAKENLLQSCRIQPLTLPDTFQDHARPEEQYAQAGLIAKGIVEKALINN